MKRKTLVLLLISFIVCSCAKNDEQNISIAAGGTAPEIKILREHIALFEKENPGVKVKLLQLPPSSSQQHDVFVTYLSAKDSSIDIFNLDIIWIAEFAAAGWLKPLDPYWPINDQKDFLKGTIQACTYQQKPYAVPWFTSCGLLYSRIDVLKKHGFDIPQNWAELKNTVQKIKTKESHWIGFVWQAAQYEGLVCNFYEALWANNGFKGALVRMKEAITLDISPKSVLSFKEEDARRLFTDGKALFMRNWPYVWSIINQEGSPLKGKVALSAITWGDRKKSASCLGGWNLALNKYSKEPELAWMLIRFLTAKKQMLEKCIATGEFPTRISLLNDPLIQANNPYWNNIYEILINARSRPQTPFYSDWSLVVQLEVSKLLSGKIQKLEEICDLLDKKWKAFIDLEEKRQ